MRITDEEKASAVVTYVPGDQARHYAIHVLNVDGSIARTIYVDLVTGSTEVEIPEVPE